MEKINGINLPSEYIPEFKWVEDIQYFEGTLTAEYTTSRGELYLFHWCDCSNTLNRWLAARTTKRALYELTSGLISMRDFFDKKILDENVYLLDIDSSENIQSATLVHLNNISGEYLPEPDIYICPDLIPDSSSSKYPVLIDKNWSDYDLSIFPRKFMDAYAFINKYLSAPKNSNEIPEKMTSAAWNGGIASMGFYSSLRHELRGSLGINAIHYASPGYIQFNAEREIGLLVKKNVDAYLDNKKTIDTTFREVSVYLRDNKLNEDNMTPDFIQNEWLEKNGGKLMLYFSEPEWEWIKVNTPDTFRAIKVSMSYYRRIKSLADYVIEDKAIFGRV